MNGKFIVIVNFTIPKVECQRIGNKKKEKKKKQTAEQTLQDGRMSRRKLKIAIAKLYQNGGVIATIPT